MLLTDGVREAATRAWDRQIRDAGLRTTAPRRAVLSLLDALARPATHAEVADALMPEGWDRATLYRNLTDLADAGLLTRHDLGDHVWRYELTKPDLGHGDVHPHFVCTSCGGVSCLPSLTLPLQDVPRAVQAGKVEVRMHGVCDRCDSSR